MIRSNVNVDVSIETFFDQLSSVYDILQPHDPGDQPPLQPAVSSSTLGSSLDESESEQHADEEEEEEVGGSSSSGWLSQPEDEKVDDFTSSILAAVSFWCFLSSSGTVRVSAANPGFFSKMAALHHMLTAQLMALTLLAALALRCSVR